MFESSMRESSYRLMLFCLLMDRVLGASVAPNRPVVAGAPNPPNPPAAGAAVVAAGAPNKPPPKPPKPPAAGAAVAAGAGAVAVLPNSDDPAAGAVVAAGNPNPPVAAGAVVVPVAAALAVAALCDCSDVDCAVEETSGAALGAFRSNAANESISNRQ